MKERSRRALLSLFNAVVVDDPFADHEVSSAVIKRMLRNGYYVSRSVPITSGLLDDIEAVIALSGEKMNAAFHKSWGVVRDTPLEVLVLQQLIHYMTTYGAEQDGVYDSECVYIPLEILDIPEVTSLPLVYIQGITVEQLYRSVISLGLGAALAQDTLNKLRTIVEGYQLSVEVLLPEIRNKELKVVLKDFLGIVPSDPLEYLRFVVWKLTGDTLLIKSRALIAKLRDLNLEQRAALDALLEKAPEDLPKIFYRFKPIFLALKHSSANKTFFNRLRKLAPRMHAAMPEDFLNSVTAKARHGNLSITKLKHKLKTASSFRKVRLLNSLLYRQNPADSISYKIRNGKVWAAPFLHKDFRVSDEVVDTVFNSLVEGLIEKLSGKLFYIPEGVHYALPATEKQFTGNFPSGTAFSVDQDLIVGVQWHNTPSTRVDLDLSMLSPQGKVGWDSSYRTQDILFSGDVVDAAGPQGATELFYIKHTLPEAKILFVNHYNFNTFLLKRCREPVVLKLLIAREQPDNFKQNYVVDPNNVVASTSLELAAPSLMLGFISSYKGRMRVVFSQGSLSKGTSARMTTSLAHRYKHLLNAPVVSLDKVFLAAGARITTSLPPDGNFIDLSPEVLDKATILELMR